MEGPAVGDMAAVEPSSPVAVFCQYSGCSVDRLYAFMTVNDSEDDRRGD